MTINDHIYAVKYIATGGVLSDDFPYPDALIKHMISVARSAILEQKMSKYFPVSLNNYQTIKMELENVDPVTCEGNYCGKSTKDAIPAFIVSRRGTGIRVTDADGNPILQTNIQRQYLQESLKIKKKTPTWHFVNGKIVVANAPLLNFIYVTGLFDEPSSLCGDGDDSCDTEYPMDMDITDAVYKYVVDILFKSYAQGRDTSNDASFNRSQGPNVAR